MEERLIEDFITYISNATRNKVIYPQGHPIITRSLMRTFEILENLLEERERVSLAAIGDELIFEGITLHEASVARYGFTRELRQREIEKVTFLKGLKNEDFLGLIDLLVMRPEQLKNIGGPIEALASKGIKNIVLGKIGDPQEFQPELVYGEEESKVRAKEYYREAIDAIKRVVEDIEFKRRINLEKARYAINCVVASIQRNRTPLITLASLKAHDEYTFSHAVNVAVLTLVQAEALGLDRQTLNDLGIAALLHDVGKLKVPEEILKKPARLTAEEFEVIKLHPANGAKILLSTPGINKLAYVVTFEHHIKYDLSGYPPVSPGRKLNLGSMLVRIADTYDAMRSNRYYAKETPPEKTIKEMEEASGKEFDPVLLRKFIRLIGVYPPGTFVRLDTNELGFVIQTNPYDPYRPRAKIIIDSNGSRIENPQEVDLEEKIPETGSFRRSVKESVDPEQFGILPEEYL